VKSTLRGYPVGRFERTVNRDSGTRMGEEGELKSDLNEERWGRMTEKGGTVEMQNGATVYVNRPL
jgi:hypothetical protein